MYHQMFTNQGNAADARSLHYSQEMSKLEEHQPENVKQKTAHA